jgi:hypothetical protein
VIYFFNGRKRSFGGDSSEVYAQVSVDFRDYLYHFKGASLAVFLGISLHANEQGWSWPSYDTLAIATGYSPDTIRAALRDLCELVINEHRVLLRYQPQGEQDGQFVSNHYLIFPSGEEVAEYEGAGVRHLGNTGKGFEPWREKPTTADRGGKNPADRGGKTPPQTITIEPSPYDDDDVSMHDHEQEKAVGDEAGSADAVAALMDAGWNAGEANAAGFVATHGAGYIVDICRHAKAHEFGAGWIRKNAGTWKPTKGNGRAPVGDDAEEVRAREVVDSWRAVVCPKCWQRPCCCAVEVRA